METSGRAHRRGPETRAEQRNFPPRSPVTPWPDVNGGDPRVRPQTALGLDCGRNRWTRSGRSSAWSDLGHRPPGHGV